MKIRQKMESVRPMFLFMDHGNMTAWDAIGQELLSYTTYPAAFSHSYTSLIPFAYCWLLLGSTS